MNRFMDLVMSSFKVGNRRRIVNNEQILCASHFGKLFEYRHLFPGPVFIIIGTDSRILIVVVAPWMIPAMVFDSLQMCGGLL